MTLPETLAVHLSAFLTETRLVLQVADSEKHIHLARAHEHLVAFKQLRAQVRREGVNPWHG